jgi:hypothetical protein
MGGRRVRVVLLINQACHPAKEHEEVSQGDGHNS